MNRRDTPLSLEELVDLELQLAADVSMETRELVARDAGIAREIGASQWASSPHDLIRAWLEAVRMRGAPSIGRRMRRYYQIAGVVLCMAAFVSGATAAAAVLRYDGRDPVNLMGFLAVFVLLQLLLTALAVLGMLPMPWKRRLFRLNAIQELLRDIGYRRSGFVAALDRRLDASPAARATIGHLARTQSIYAGVERWMLVSVTQRAGVAFNVGALVVCMYLVTVQALAFAWSTTLEIDPETMTRIFQLVALPWSWLHAAVPSRDLVEASRYFPGRAYDADRLGDWWPFLIAALATYGLLPRLALATFAAWRETAARRALDLDHGGCAFLRDRLLRATAGWGAGAELGTEIPAEQRGAVGEVGAPPLLRIGQGELRVLVWADAAVTREDVARWVGESRNCEVVSFVAVRGDGGARDLEAISSLCADAANAPILVLAEAWEPPSKSIQHLLRDVREKAGPAVPIVVGLILGDASRGTAKDDVTIWRQRAAAMADPRLSVEVVGT